MRWSDISRTGIPPEAPVPHALRVLAVGGPTAVIEFAGLRLMTDPTFDPPGEQPRGLMKLTGPAVRADDIGEIDAVLLSHDHHPDNLDQSGRAFLPRVPHVLTTGAGAERLGGNATGLAPWSSLRLQRPTGGSLTVTALPAQHGPDGSDPIMGPVIGFALTAEDTPPLYISGDNASLDIVRVIVARLGQIELAVLFAGAARVQARFDGALLTLSSEAAAEATRILGSRAVIPLHFEGWAHFSEGAETLRSAFEAAGLADRLHIPEPGHSVSV
jgi:L-ascorbate metabolism protein UlaG (beta-lactamase superfamily)